MGLLEKKKSSNGISLIISHRIYIFFPLDRNNFARDELYQDGDVSFAFHYLRMCSKKKRKKKLLSQFVQRALSPTP